MASELIYTEEDILAMLDNLLTNLGSDWWNEFYEDRAKPCPFFVESPDENLAHWFEEVEICSGKALDLGCGNGRNAIFLAHQGFAVEGVDFSRKVIDWATERVRDAGVPVELRCQSVFDLEYEESSYDVVYDSGCFHHIPPHRRRSYVELVTTALKPNGWFGLTCFRPEGGSGYSDCEVYERRSLGGGLGYTEEHLREIWSELLNVRVIRQMTKQNPESGLFGEEYLWALWAQTSP